MRDLTTDDLGLLISLFAVLLISFAIDFGVSKRAMRKHRRSVMFFGLVALVGEVTSALTIVLCWVALWSPAAWERIDNRLVFSAGTIAILCAVILTIDKGIARVEALRHHRSQAAEGTAVSPPA